MIYSVAGESAMFISLEDGCGELVEDLHEFLGLEQSVQLVP